jgi:hypothetical protein
MRATGQQDFAANPPRGDKGRDSQRGGNAMNHAINQAKLDVNETDILVHEVSDEALEAAACAGAGGVGAFTIAMCTGQSECPY